MRKDNEDVFKVIYLRLKQVYKFYFQDINFLVPTKPTNEILGTFVCKIDVPAGRFSPKIGGIVKISELRLAAYITLPNIIRYKKAG